MRINILVIWLMPLLAWGHDGLVKSMRVCRADDAWGTPVIALGDTEDRVLIEFDQMGNDRSYLRYELIHCDADWTPSGLTAPEYLDGFNEGTIDDYAYSSATLWPYVHYAITLPNEQMRITASGNYEVRIYDEQEPEVTLATARFSMCDFTMRVGADLSARTDIGSNDGHQQLDVVVDMQHEPVRDPFNDLKVVVTQNNQPENRVVVSHPMRVQGARAYFEHDRSLIFDGGNEYRRFESTTTRPGSMGVERVEFEEPYYYVVLTPDQPRAGNSYLYDQTQNGRFIARNTDGFDPDYVMACFTLEMPRMEGVDVFIDGDFTGRRFTPENKMQYDYDAGAYHGQMLIKQGYYEYRYVTVPKADVKIDGDYSDTQNEYSVMVYHRPPGTRYDRLCGYAVVKK